MTASVHIVQAFFLLPVIESMRNTGSNVDAPISAVDLDKFRFEDPDTSLPLNRANALLEHFARTETGPRLPAAVLSHYSIQNMAEWGKAILACPDLLTAVKMATQPGASMFTNNVLSLIVDGPTATFIDHFTTADSLAQEWWSLFSAFLAIDGFRAACGPDWKPLELDVASSDISALEGVLDLSGVIVRNGCRSNCMRFRTSDLTRRMPIATDGRNGLSVMPANVRRCVFNVLDGLACDVVPSENLIAELFDMSARTLQRRLREEETTFFEVIDRWRMAKSLELVADPRLPVSEVSAQLHYANSSHFSRAFRRWTGTTPLVYRETAANQRR